MVPEPHFKPLLTLLLTVLALGLAVGLTWLHG